MAGKLELDIGAAFVDADSGADRERG